MPVHLLGARTAGLTSGIGNFFANLGGFTFIYALGSIRDSTGSFALGLYLLAGASGAGALCTLGLSRIRLAPAAEASDA
jgi:hypothetical protein